MGKWSTGKKIRRGILAAVLLLMLILGHVAGVFIDFAILACWAVPVLWMKIFKTGTKYIAKTNAQAIVDAQNANAQPPAES